MLSVRVSLGTGKTALKQLHSADPGIFVIYHRRHTLPIPVMMPSLPELCRRKSTLDLQSSRPQTV